MQLQPDRGRFLLRIEHGALFAIAFATLSTAPVRAGITYTDLYMVGSPSGNGDIQTGNLDSQNHQYATGGQLTGIGPTGYKSHAVVWSPASPNGVDLHPDQAFYRSGAYGTDGVRQVGYGVTIDNAAHAVVWSGTATSYVDLQPANYGSSYAYGVGGTRQVGYAAEPTGFYYHAMLWSGTAASYVDLHPASGYSNSYAYGVSASQIVGVGKTVLGSKHAALWSNTAASFVDLQPQGFDETWAYGTDGTQQVGVGSGLSPTHALMWSGTAASYVDLHPGGSFVYSQAFSVSAGRQVGDGIIYVAGSGYFSHALLWSGTAASYVDLGALLPSTFTNSFASTIIGNTVYGYAIDTNGKRHAISWIVPEPSDVALLALGGTMLCQRRRRM